MKATDLKMGSVIEIKVNYSPSQMNVPVQVKIYRATDSFIWYKHNSLQRISRNTFQWQMDNLGHKIISL